jgi:aspartokinase/homoserine dehydrogenase 1
MKILKFGGSSVGSPDRIKNAAAIIIDAYNADKNIAVVVSAYQGVTDELIRLSNLAASGNESYKDDFKVLCDKHINFAKELLPLNKQSIVLANIKVWLNDLQDILHGVFLVGEYSKRMLDYVMSFGERFSAYTINAYISTLNVPTEFLDTRELIKCDEAWGGAKVDFKISNQKISEYFENCKNLPVATGFIASTSKNDTITLGRGGSDYTAAIIGAALNCKEIEIWTDVDGVMTADPRKVPKAFYIPALTYQEIMELSHFGAKVVYPPTIQPALDANIPVSIKNTFNPKFIGSRISDSVSGHKYLITGISSIEAIALLRLEGSGMVGVAGVSMRLFAALAKKEISVILITQASSEHTICFAVLPDFAEEAKNAIEKEFALEVSLHMIEPVSVEKDVSIVSIVGENMRKMPGISAKLFRALGNNGINVIAIAQGSSELNISVVVNKNNEKKALNALHDEFFFTENKTLNLFIAGTGLIGSTLLKQISSHEAQLKKEHNLELKVTGLINSRKALIGTEKIDISNTQDTLTSSDKIAATDFVDSMIKLNLPNSVFVDCTASEEVIKYYEKILDNSIAIVTPNKKAQTRSLDIYKALKQTARKRSVPFLFETSVGAGLPVISTLNDLIKSGDQVIKIEAVLSGTLSYIFNSFDGSKPFSEVVMEAKEKGYTEPDPRDDLCGLDFARKLLILARESGINLEQSDVKVENLVPERCRDAKTIEEFFTKLKNEDSYFGDKVSKAKASNKKLCYIGQIEGNTAAVSLIEVDASHPFSSLSGSDNIISFTTQRYNQRPLVVKGPGAGAEVTAAGVFADIIRVAYVG